MRKVMIVDDESLVRIGLQSIIEWEDRGYQITGVFKNGEEALEAAKQQHFDVVLTDIRMPGMDGFELIRQLKKIDPILKYIILSSYSDFEYTRQAIQLGVMDYISKYEMEPVELLRVLDSLQFSPVELQYPVAKSHSLTSILEDEKQKMLALTSKPNDIRIEAEFPGIYDRFTQWGGNMYWICMKPFPRETGYSPAERKAMTLQTEEIFSRMKQLDFMGEDSGILHGSFLFGSEEQRTDNEKSLRQIAEELTAAWAKNLNISLITGISSEAPIERIGQLRSEAEAVILVSFYEEGTGVYFGGEHSLRHFTEQEALEWYKHVKSRIHYLHFRELTDELVTQLNHQDSRLYPSEWLRLGETIAAQLMDLLIERYDLDVDSIRSQFGTLWPLSDAFRKVSTRSEYIDVIEQLMSGTQQTISALQTSRGWLLPVKQYVESHYDQPIRMEEMAEKVSFSPNHFSQRFRQETGESFSDYVTRIRIREAIRLYRETDHSTEEIAVRVGYMNPNYFIKVFKKTTGQTIKQFKQRF